MEEDRKSQPGEEGVPPSADVLPPTLIVPSSDASERGRVSRSPSPARIPGGIASRIFDQMERLSMLKELAQAVSQAMDRDSPLTVVARWEQQVDELFKEFTAVHDYISEHWPTGNLNHPYFTDRVLRAATNVRNNCNLVLTRLTEDRLRQAPARSDISHSDGAQMIPKLPKLDLPKFSGTLLEWTNFSELFSSLVLDQRNISEVQKLQYLKLSLGGEPARLVAGFPLQDGQLQLAWESLKARYEDKRRMIASYFDRVLDLKPCASGNQKELAKIFNVISEASKTVRALAEQRDHGDLLWAHLLARNLDGPLRQDLEFSLASSKEPPTYAEVEEFVRKKLRALEATEHSREGAARKGTSKSSGSTHQPTKGSGLQASSQSSSASSYSGYACDCCQGSHYIATCATFLAKPAKEKRAFVVEKRLCFNCLGRHSARACKSTQLCKMCRGKHHTQLHEASLHNQPAPPAAAQPGPSSAPQ